MDPLVLETGAKYRGCIAVETVSDMVSVSPKRVTDMLNKAGFTDVQVWTDEEGLPTSWPEADREDTTPFGWTAYWVEGTWKGADKQQIPSSGDHWRIVWMRKIENAPELDSKCKQDYDACLAADKLTDDECKAIFDKCVTPDPNRYEQDVPPSKYRWIPILTVGAVCIGSVWFLAKAKER